MSTAAVIMMAFMLGVYFGGFVYFALRKEPKRPKSQKPPPPPGPIVTP
jgi:preprotein translocase subunit YajC